MYGSEEIVMNEMREGCRGRELVLKIVFPSWSSQVGCTRQSYPRVTALDAGCAPVPTIELKLYLDSRHNDEDDCTVHGAPGTWGIRSVWHCRQRLPIGIRGGEHGRVAECHQWYVYVHERSSTAVDAGVLCVG